MKLWRRLLLLGAAGAVADAATVTVASGKHGAVASEVGECSQIGLDTLKKGGSAGDAMIATALCVGTIAAYHSGIGGGGFGIVRSIEKSGKPSYEMIDFRETMPALGNETLYVNSSDPKASTIGGLAVGVPGELRGWQVLHKRYGKLPWKTLFQPSIKLARDGFVVNPDLANALSPASYPFLLEDPLFAETYAPNGTLAKLGDTIKRTRFARTLQTLAEEGPDAFYEGPIAVNIASATWARGGILTVHDLKNYSAILRTPANITYRNKYRIWSTIAPSSGSVVLSALKVFEGYNGSALPNEAAINETTHKLIQATRFGYGQRTNFGDPAYTANVSTLEAEFITAETAASVRAKIDEDNHPALYYNVNNYLVLNDGGTSHIAVADKDGNAVSLTTTVNLYWGSRVMTADGIILNDEMDDFSSPGQTNAFGFAASPANYIRPGKRPQSSISSSIVEDLHTGEFVLATGSAGGSRIITATLQNIYHHIDQGLDANTSAHYPRWHDQLGPSTLFELPAPTLGLAGFSNGTVAFLAAKGYNISYQDTSGSTSHIITRSKDGVFEAAADPRKAAGKGLAF